MTKPRSPASVLFFAFGFLFVGCGPVYAEHAASSVESIIAGTDDDDGVANNAVVSLRIGDGTEFVLCSATVIAPNVVLTARHCVSTELTSTVMCDQLGHSTNAPHFGSDFPPEQVHVYIGPKPQYAAPPDANGQAVFHPDSEVLCNEDIALIVLDRELTGITPLKIRLGSGPSSDENVRAVGFGQNNLGEPLGTRIRKDDVQVLAIGETFSAYQTPLAENEFEVGLSICQGDSGGPAISENTGAVIGVVSRGSACTDNFGHIYTKPSGFFALFEQAFTAAGADLSASREANDHDPPAGATPDALETTTNADPGESCSMQPLPQSGGTNISRAPAPDALAWLGIGAAFALRRRRAKS